MSNQPQPMLFADVVTALQRLRPGADFNVTGDTYDGIDWRDTQQTKPTLEEVNAEIAVIEAEIPTYYCVTEAKRRIALSDWAVLPDVNIANRADFEAYRAALRALILNPVESPTWPIEPNPVWE